MAYERIVKRFYDELENGIIMGRKCKRCGHVEFPPVLACNECSCPDMEWVEMDGRVTVTDLVAPSIMTMLEQYEDLEPYMFGIGVTQEGTGVNVVIRNVDSEREAELKAKLPLQAKMAICQMDGFKTVILDLVEEG